ncbi:ABC transporter family substrate-binding protein [Allonocardiopsis opalescens]|uniref:Peptide/nickel transport system substrate-binding protein n=1 Tax=Allonocardiopsis opalescens TaxID=1144618 RepID=A0A2T0PVF4_9ACTN|nr:ABC transporter family substrate-binding protein [Allonocardiopsis opalescens]PRX95513.1 peptide/nickel transport system substrate-binding protein [Allonocardiopsis opalescens]
MRRYRRWVSFAAPVAALALLASACGGGGGESGEAESQGPDFGDIPIIDIAATPREEIEPGGEFVWALSAYDSQYNLLHPDGNLANVDRIMNAVLPTIWDYDETGAVTPDPDYLVDFEYDESGETPVLTLTLNPEGVWSNGDPITWEDFQSQWEAVMGADDGYQVGSTTGYDRIESIEQGEDEYQVVVTYAEPFGEYQHTFAQLYPREYTSDPERFNEGYLEDIPVTAGPFNFVERDDTSQTITLERNEDFWGDPALLDRLIFRGMATDAMAGAFINEEIDAFEIATDATAYQRVQEEAPHGVIRRAPDNGFRFLQYNGSSEIMSDPLVRQAVSQGINREAIASSTFEGLDWPSVLLNNRLLLSTAEHYQDNGGDLAEYNPEEAGAKLDEAGWTLAEGAEVRTNAEGEELRLRYVYPAGIQTSQNEAELVQAMLAEIGIAVEPEAQDVNVYFTDYIYAANFDIAGFVLISSNPFQSDSEENWVMPPEGSEDWGNNTGFTGTPEIDATFAEALTEADPAARAATINEIDQMLWENGMSLPLFQRPGIFAVDSDVVNYGARGLASIRYQDIGRVAQ